MPSAPPKRCSESPASRVCITSGGKRLFAAERGRSKTRLMALLAEIAGLRCLTLAGVYQSCFRRRSASSLAALAFERSHHDRRGTSGW